MSTIKVLIVDDSFIVQEILKEMLSTDGEIEVLDTASNGKEGIKKAKTLNPDMITMDLNMPVMNGLDAIHEIMEEKPTKILVISSMSEAKIAFDACAHGAMDLFPKEEIKPENAKKLTEKIKSLAKIRSVKPSWSETPAQQPMTKTTGTKKVIAIASSTGGPKALSALLPMLPSNLPHPIVIAQHLEDAFLSGLIKSLNQVAKIHVEGGHDDSHLEGGRAIFSPPEKHIEVDESGKIYFVDRKPTDTYSPCCDLLLTSVASVFGNQSVGVILSGLGEDGVRGIEAIKKKGGLTIAQDESSSIVFGMNKVAIDKGFIDHVMPISEIGRFLSNL